MKHTCRTLCILCGLAVGQACAAVAGPGSPEPLPPPAARKVEFLRDVKPIFEASCLNCHGRGRSKGGFQLDTRKTLLAGGDSGPAVVPGKSSESLLIQLVAGVDPDNVMPRKGSRLTAGQIGLLRAWVDQGLAWPARVSFARPAPVNLEPPVPKFKVSPGASANRVDQLLKPYFKAHHFKPAPVVDDRRFARRAFLDVLGLLPSPAELDAFCNDTGRDKRARLVRQLLADDQRYAVNWLSFWNDLLRNDYRGTGYIDNGRKQITAWLYSALVTNLPYDRFVAQLLSPTPASEGFSRGIVWRGVVNASQLPPLQAAQNISQVFMGVNLKCASCHDSFINDWQLADAYGLASIYSDTPLELFQCDKPTGRMAETKFIYPQLGTIDPNADKPARLQRLAQLVTSPQDGRLSRTIVNRLWARFFGRGLVEPVDDMDQHAWNQDLLDWLAADLVAHHYDLKQAVERILTSRAYQLPAVDLGETPAKDFVFRGPAVRRLTAEQFRDALGELSGVWYDRAEYRAATNQVRAALVAADPLMTALGRPNREQVITTRSSAATTLQALELTNGETLAEVLHRGAARLAGQGSSSQALLDHLYRGALGREPTGSEAVIAIALLGNPPRPEGLEDLLWAIAMLPEFQLID